jgi:hypothetical protein
LLYFARPYIQGWGLQSFIKTTLDLDGRRVLCESLASASLPPLAAEDNERQHQNVIARLQELEEQGFIKQTNRRGAVQRPLSVPTDIGRIYSDFESRCQRLVRVYDRLTAVDASSSVENEANKQRHIDSERHHAFNQLVEKTLGQNDISLQQLAHSERGIQLCLGRFVEALLTACGGVGCAHQQGILHLHLYPGAIFIGDSGGDVYVTNWRDAHVQGTESSQYWSGPPRRERDPWQCEPPEADSNALVEWGPTFDIFALGGVLSFILHEPSGTSPNESALFREAFAPSTGTSSGDTQSFATDLKQVCLRAQEADPRNRYPQVGEFAAALAHCLAAARKNGHV